MSPKARAEVVVLERAMDAIYDAEATLDLQQTLWTANQDAGPLKLGMDYEHTAEPSARRKRYLKRAREAVERVEG